MLSAWKPSRLDINEPGGRTPAMTASSERAICTTPTTTRLCPTQTRRQRRPSIYQRVGKSRFKKGPRLRRYSIPPVSGLCPRVTWMTWRQFSTDQTLYWTPLWVTIAIGSVDIYRLRLAFLLAGNVGTDHQSLFNTPNADGRTEMVSTTNPEVSAHQSHGVKGSCQDKSYTGCFRVRVLGEEGA